MRPFTILYITIFLACTVHVWRYHQNMTAIEKWRLAALDGSTSAMQSLRDTTIFILPWEQCAWGWILAERDTGQRLAMSDVPVCRQMIKPEGESLMLDYKTRLKRRMQTNG